MKFIGKPAGLADDLPVIIYFSDFINFNTDGESNKWF